MPKTICPESLHETGTAWIEPTTELVHHTCTDCTVIN